MEQINKLTPKELIQTYYDSLVKEDYVTAKACLGGRVLEDADSYLSNFKSIRGVRIERFIESREEGKSEFDGYFNLVEAVVTYEAEFRKQGPDFDGPQTRFVVVGKRTPESYWRIVGIGTGP